MKYINKKISSVFLMAASAVVILSSCNKDLEQIPGPAPTPVGDTTQNLNNLIRNDATLTFFRAAIVRAGLTTTLANPTSRYTVFAPTDAAFIASGIPSIAVINSLPLATVTALVSYNIVPQNVLTTGIPSTFPNFQYPTIFNPAPTLSALLRLTTFPTIRNGNWVNNIPLTSVNTVTGNGVLHKTALVVAPPQRALWERIQTDAGLKYLRAAIIRADSGVVAASTLQAALGNIGANLTVFAPTDAAFQATLTGLITQALIAQGVPPATAAATAALLASNENVFQNPALYGSLSAQTVKGVVVYHLLGVRAFSNNLPTTVTNYPTLLNTAIPAHPGVGLLAAFTGGQVSAASVKGAANASAANFLINPTPDAAASYGTTVPAPGLTTYTGTSDQHYTNGVLHKINQVLLAQ
jgi:uncharacterized surface protein with fasciclin (FAS1) repeats